MPHPQLPGCGDHGPAGDERVGVAGEERHREAERAERAEARIDELLARLNTRTTGDVEGT